LIRGRFEQGAPVVDCFISIPAMGINSPEPITLLVDTGASLSLLQPADALRLGIDPARLADDPRSELVGGVGGSTRVVVTTMLLDFAEDVARGRPYRHPIGVAGTAPSNATLPSILGMDFISHFRLTVARRDDRVELDPAF
jgi:hypothetical protein